jgi:hypothetical protein
MSKIQSFNYYFLIAIINPKIHFVVQMYLFKKKYIP